MPEDREATASPESWLAAACSRAGGRNCRNDRGLPRLGSKGNAQRSGVNFWRGRFAKKGIGGAVATFPQTARIFVLSYFQ
jgi:hypothetical protein